MKKVVAIGVMSAIVMAITVMGCGKKKVGAPTGRPPQIKGTATAKKDERKAPTPVSSARSVNDFYTRTWIANMDIQGDLETSLKATLNYYFQSGADAAYKKLVAATCRQLVKYIYDDGFFNPQNEGSENYGVEIQNAPCPGKSLQTDESKIALYFDELKGSYVQGNPWVYSLTTYRDDEFTSTFGKYTWDGSNPSAPVANLIELCSEASPILRCPRNTSIQSFARIVDTKPFSIEN